MWLQLGTQSLDRIAQSVGIGHPGKSKLKASRDASRASGGWVTGGGTGGHSMYTAPTVITAPVSGLVDERSQGMGSSLLHPLFNVYIE